MLLTGSSIRRSFESNNFAIADHLEEGHKDKKRQFTRAKQRTLALPSALLWHLQKDPKARMKLTLPVHRKQNVEVPH